MTTTDLRVRDLEDTIRRAERKLAAALGRDPDGELSTLTFLVAEAVEFIPRPPDYCQACGDEVKMLTYAPAWCSQRCSELFVCDGYTEHQRCHDADGPEEAAEPVVNGPGYEGECRGDCEVCTEGVRSDPHGVVIPPDWKRQQAEDCAAVARVADGIKR